MKRLFITPVIALSTVLLAAPFAFGADGSENIRLTVPADIQYKVKGDGSLISPSEDTLVMENNSNFEVRIASMTMMPADGWNIVDDAYQSTLPNSISIKLGPSSNKMKLSSCVAASRDVDNKQAWTMASKDVSEEAASIQLASEGYATNIQNVGTSVGSVEWYIVSDTVTNQVLSDIEVLQAKVAQLEEKVAECPMPVGTILQLANTQDPNTMYPNTTWEKVEGKVLLGTSSSYSLGSTGGEATTTLTTNNLPSHTHTYNKADGTSGSTTLSVANLPSHTHTYNKADGTSGSTTLTINQIPSHSHEIRNQNGSGSNGICATNSTSGSDGNNWCFMDVMVDKTANASGTFGTTSVGGSQGHTHSVTSTSTNSGATGSGTGHTHTVSSTSTNSGATGSGTSFSNMMPYEAVNMWKRTA